MERRKEASVRQAVNAISESPTPPKKSPDRLQRDAWDYNCADPWL
jgi:hypothetical protein